MRDWMIWIMFVGLVVFSPVVVHSAEQAPGVFRGYYDQNDVLCVLGFTKDAGQPPDAPRSGEFTLVPGPYFGMNPTVGTIFGVGANGLFYLGEPATTRLSTIDNLVAFTTNRQFIFYSRSTVVSADNDWEFFGDWRFYGFSQPTFILSTDNFTSSNPEFIQFSHLRWHETALRRVSGNVYAGAGCNLDFHSGIKASDLDEHTGPLPISTHTLYSQQYGFHTASYATCGLNLNLLYESRDHVLNPYCGQFALLTYTFNLTGLGSSQNSQVVYGEYRHYFPLSMDPSRHLIGIWAYTRMVTQGNLPYLDLPASGSDLRERSGRGYMQGRWRGTQLAYLETEYRFPLTTDGLLGGVLFANATSAASPAQYNPEQGISDPGVKLFEYIKPALGMGLRLMLVRSIRMNAEVDIAWGVEGSSRLYLNLFEIF